MKKLVSIVLIILTLFSLLSCSSDEPHTETWDSIIITKDNLFDYFDLTLINTQGENHYNPSGELMYIVTEYNFSLTLKEELEKNYHSTLNPDTSEAHMVVTVKGNRTANVAEHESLVVDFYSSSSTYFRVRYAYTESEVAENKDYSHFYYINDFLDPDFGFIIDVDLFK